MMPPIYRPQVEASSSSEERKRERLGPRRLPAAVCPAWRDTAHLCECSWAVFECPWAFSLCSWAEVACCLALSCSPTEWW